ncbi:MAG: hypothetical protein U1C53_03300, partial [Candidatus Veblenbacteria bacterium]|nr:hypothetical protein [Candidatus Veblenbacteria bacterium]
MKNQGKMFLYIIGVVASFFISLPVKADPLFDACKKTWGADYTPVVGIPGVEYNLNDENDPRDNTCGVEGSNVLCPGAYENLGNGNNSDTSSGCCKRVVNSVTEYRCVAFGSVVSTVTTVPDATKVDIKA